MQDGDAQTSTRAPDLTPRRPTRVSSSLKGYIYIIRVSAAGISVSHQGLQATSRPVFNPTPRALGPCNGRGLTPSPPAGRDVTNDKRSPVFAPSRPNPASCSLHGLDTGPGTLIPPSGTTFSVIYSKTSLNQPFVGVNACGPFREVVDLQNFTKT